MDAVWILAALIVMLAALGLAVWLVSLGRKMHEYVTRAGEAARMLSAAAERAEAEYPPQHRAEPNDPPEVVERAAWTDDPPPVQSQARVRDRCAPDEAPPYPYDEWDDD